MQTASQHSATTSADVTAGTGTSKWATYWLDAEVARSTVNINFTASCPEFDHPTYGALVFFLFRALHFFSKMNERTKCVLLWHSKLALWICPALSGTVDREYHTGAGMSPNLSENPWRVPRHQKDTRVIKFYEYEHLHGNWKEIDFLRPEHNV